MAGPRSQASLSTEGGRRCPVCSARCAPRIDAGDFTLFECPACACWSSDAQVRGTAVSFESRRDFEHADRDVARWERVFLRLPDRGRAVGSVLDVGCGSGGFLHQAGLRFHAAHLVGVERDAKRAEHARRSHPKAWIHEGDALEVTRRLQDRFELITLHGVLEQVTAPRALLEALATRLAPGGLLYVETCHAQGWLLTAARLAFRLSRGRLREPVRRAHAPHHLVCFSRPGLEHLASSVGLRLRGLWLARWAEGARRGGRRVDLLLERPDDTE